MDDFDYYPLVETACLVAMNPEKATLYFSLAVVGGFLISVTVMCGHWMALKLAPISNDRAAMYSHQSTMTVNHQNDSGCDVATSLPPTTSHHSIMTQTSIDDDEQPFSRSRAHTNQSYHQQILPSSSQNPSYRLSFLEELRSTTQTKEGQSDVRDTASAGGERISKNKGSSNPFSEDEDEEDEDDQGDSGRGQSVCERPPLPAAPVSRAAVGRPGSIAPSTNYTELNYDEEEDYDDYEDYEQYYDPENRHTQRASVVCSAEKWRNSQQQQGGAGHHNKHLSTMDIDHHIGLRHSVASNNRSHQHSDRSRRRYSWVFIRETLV